MQTFQSLLEFFGGLAIFIYGVHLLSEGLEKVAGSKLLSFLDRSLKNPLRQGLFGLVATALMHSSGLLMVTMIELINANLVTLQQAIGIMLGQEIGTTITGQLVSFKIGSFNQIFLITGFFLMFFSAKPKLRAVGQPLFGFGIVFPGMYFMSKASGTISRACLKGVRTDDKKFVDQVTKSEEEIDELEKTFKYNHIERLKKKICNPDLDTIFVDCLRNLERISDHSYNIALSLVY